MNDSSEYKSDYVKHIKKENLYLIGECKDKFNNNKIDFGKYKGTRYEELPSHYLLWLLRDDKKTVLYELEDHFKIMDCLNVINKCKDKFNNTKINFGKFKGTPYEEIPFNYLEYILKNSSNYNKEDYKNNMFRN